MKFYGLNFAQKILIYGALANESYDQFKLERLINEIRNHPIVSEVAIVIAFPFSCVLNVIMSPFRSMFRAIKALREFDDLYAEYIDEYEFVTKEEIYKMMGVYPFYVNTEEDEES